MGREVADSGLPPAAESYLLLLGPEVTDLLLVLLPEPLHVLPGLLQQIPLPPQLPILPSQHVHVILQLRLVTQEPAVEGAKTPQKHLDLTNFSPYSIPRYPRSPKEIKTVAIGARPIVFSGRPNPENKQTPKRLNPNSENPNTKRNTNIPKERR